MNSVNFNKKISLFVEVVAVTVYCVPASLYHQFRAALGTGILVDISWHSTELMRCTYL